LTQSVKHASFELWCFVEKQDSAMSQRDKSNAWDSPTTTDDRNRTGRMVWRLKGRTTLQCAHSAGCACN
jgi:hypothetical protein